MKKIAGLLLLIIWMGMFLLMAAEPNMHDSMNESVVEAPKWIGWAFIALIFGIPFAAIKLMETKTK